MSKVSQNSDVSGCKTVEDLGTYVSRALQDIITTVNGKLDFQNNIASVFASGSISSANTDTAIPHSLGRTPTGFISYASACSGALFVGNSSWTSNTIYLQSTGTGSVKVIVF